VKRLEISSSEEVEVCVGNTMLGVVGLAAAVLTFAAAFCFVFPVMTSFANTGAFIRENI